MKFSFSAFLLASPCLFSTASAALLAYEGFSASNYNLGSNATGPDFPTDNLAGQGTGSGTGFTSAWIQDPSLNSRSELYWSSTGGASAAGQYARADGGQATYAGVATTAGRAVYQSSGAGQASFQRNFSTGNSAPANLFVSTLVTIDGSAAVSLGFQSTDGNTDNRPFQFGVTQSGNLFARGYSNSNDPTVTSATILTPGTYFIVARFTNDSTTNDSISLWVNPSSLTSLGAADVVLNKASAGFDTNFYVSGNSGYSIRGLVMDFKSDGSTAGSTSVDEIRIGTQLADVIPEPAILSFSFISGSLLLLRRRNVRV